ncbi:MAG: DUF2103 domain-containing protein [Candidatus Moraniibacteriota bacterium]
MPKNHRSGKKIGKNHTTVIDAAEKVVDFLVKLPDVSKVITGHITNGIKNAPASMKLEKKSGCLLIKVRGSKSIQEISIFSKNLETVQAHLKEAFQQFIKKK